MSRYYQRDCIEYGFVDMISNDVVFTEDKIIYDKIRTNIDEFLTFNKSDQCILEIGPNENTKYRFSDNTSIETVDINDALNPTYIADLTQPNVIPKNKYDIVICSEVIEHCSSPKCMLREIYNLLKPTGLIYLTTPFQFRIHGPLPDYWRITEYGIKMLLEINKYDIVDFKALIDNERPAFPLHYCVVAKKKKEDNTKEANI